MRSYLGRLKPLLECNFLRIDSDAVDDVPEEVLRMLRFHYGIAFAFSEESAFFWNIGLRTAAKLGPLEYFSGRYRIGLDSLGYYWEECDRIM